jgi:transposase
MSRIYARAVRGKRAVVREPFKKGSNFSVIGALGLRGFFAPMIIEGPINGEIFELYVERMLIGELRSGDIVIFDRINFHRSERAINLIKEVGARVEMLPAYSPDLNPIEECIWKIKENLRSEKARTKRKLYNALKRAIELITEKDIRGWFRHCGYTCSLNCKPL